MIKMPALDLKAEMMSILGTFSHQVDEALDEAMRTTAEEAAEKLKQVSPKGKGKGKGKYAKGWGFTADKGRQVYTVHNKNHYQLTHLLEKGHDVVVNGVKVGHAKAYPHIADVEAWVQEEAPKRFEEALEQ